MQRARVAGLSFPRLGLSAVLVDAVSSGENTEIPDVRIPGVENDDPIMLKIPELLAPAGTFETVVAVIDAGADAVYVAGKRFGMRQHASWLNFDDAGLVAAIDYVHSRGKKIFIAMNNLLTDAELSETEAALDAIESWMPDALIIQDLGLLHRLRLRGTSLDLHASCMMNVNSLETAKTLGRLGVSRIIASRDISLADAARLQTDSGLEFEYFLHGDMCIAQGGQCTTSGIMAGESASRGRCLKPCRWEWELVGAAGEPVPGGTGYLMARKDLSLFEHVPDLVRSGIAVLKIEGRARTSEYLTRVVAAYRTALDAYVADPCGYCADAVALDDLHKHRQRDFSTNLTFRKEGEAGIGKDGKREPRIFSVVIEQPVVSAEHTVTSGRSGICQGPELVVHCDSVEAVEAALAGGAQGICIGGERWRGHCRPMTSATVNSIARLVAEANSRLYGAAPRISESDRLTDGALPRDVSASFDGYYVHTLGQLDAARRIGQPIIADLGFNLFNAEAFAFAEDLGAVRGVVSLELGLSQLERMAPVVSSPIELVIHGPVVGMISEHCFVEAARGCTSRQRSSDHPPCAEYTALRDAAGADHTLLTDMRCRNYVLLPKRLCALPMLDDLLALQPAAMRIDGRFESVGALREIVAVYRTAIDSLTSGVDPPADGMLRLARHAPSGLSACAYDLNVADVAKPGAELPQNAWVRPEAVRWRPAKATG